MQLSIYDIQDKKTRRLLIDAHEKGKLGRSERISSTLLSIIEHLLKKHPNKPKYSSVREWARCNEIVNNVSQSVIKMAFDVCYDNQLDAIPQKKTCNIIAYAINSRFVHPLLELNQDQINSPATVERLVNRSWLLTIIPLLRYDIEQQATPQNRLFNFNQTPLTAAELCCSLLEDEDAQFSPHMCQRIIAKKLGQTISWDLAQRTRKICDDIKNASTLGLDFSAYNAVQNWITTHMIPIVIAGHKEKVERKAMEEAVGVLSNSILISLSRQTMKTF